LNIHSKERVRASRSNTFLMDFLGKKAGRVRIEAKTRNVLRIYIDRLTACKKGKRTVDRCSTCLLEVRTQETQEKFVQKSEGTSHTAHTAHQFLLSSKEFFKDIKE
jgi:hypothetical protein